MATKYENVHALVEGIEAKIARVKGIKDFPDVKLKTLKEHLVDAQRVLAELRPTEEGSK